MLQFLWVRDSLVLQTLFKEECIPFTILTVEPFYQFWMRLTSVSDLIPACWSGFSLLSPSDVPSSEAQLRLETGDPHPQLQRPCGAERPGVEHGVWGLRRGWEHEGQVPARCHVLRHILRADHRPRYWSHISYRAISPPLWRCSLIWIICIRNVLQLFTVFIRTLSSCNL